MKQQLKPTCIRSVHVEVNEDTFEGPVLHVTAVYARSGREPDPTKLLGLVSHLRPELAERGEERFPLLSFVADDEAEHYAGPN